VQPNSTEVIDYERQVLLFEGDDPHEANDLASRLIAIGAKTEVVRSFDEAQRALSSDGADFGAILIPTRFEKSILEATLRNLLTDTTAKGLAFVSVGPEPPPGLRRRLRKAGVRVALWNPINDTILRFRINRALNPSANGLEYRAKPRVPTDLLCRVSRGGRDKNAIVYSLSLNGAFLETPRASMNGAQIEIEMRYDDRVLRTGAEVVFANVPGNLQRPGLPMGMGVRFAELDMIEQKALKKYIDRCLAEQLV
jgi:hypothetical protein